MFKQFLYKFRLFRLIWRISLLEKRLDYLEAVYHERIDNQREANQTIQVYAERIKRDVHHLSLKVSGLEDNLREHILLQEMDDNERETFRIEQEINHETLVSLKRQLVIHQRNLNRQEELLAKKGSDQPLDLINEIGDLRSVIEATKRKIDDLQNN